MTPRELTVPNVAQAARDVRWFERRLDAARSPRIRALYRAALEAARERLERAEADSITP